MKNYTVIDSDNYAASGIETIFFPGGEPHAKLPKFEGRVLFCGKLRNWSDVGFAAVVIDALRHQKIDRLDAFIPYFPAARQDRSDGAAAFTLKLVARLLCNRMSDDMHYDNGVDHWTHVFDAHSDVTIENTLATNWNWENLDQPVVREAVAVIAPDAGAVKRASDYRDTFHEYSGLLEATKRRNPQTGALGGYKMPKLPAIGHYVIVDDICDGGGTFNLLMEAVLADPFGAESTFELVVSHGIFSRGLSAIHPRIEHITTTDSWCRLPSDNRLTVVKLDQLFNRIMEGI
jgi:ribose-phosphate pyrophosphokinase